MTAIEPLAQPTTRRRWPRWLLIASLALNALLVGVIMRGVMTMRANIAMSGGTIETSLPAFIETLPAARRDELRKVELPDRSGVLRPLRIEVRRLRMEANRLFMAEPFDKAAFVEAQARLFESEIKLRSAVFRMLPELGERLTASERRGYLGWHGPGWVRPGGLRRDGYRHGMDGPMLDQGPRRP